MNSARLHLSALRSGRSCRPSTARGCSIFSSGRPFSARSCAICSSGVQKLLPPVLSRRSCSSLATHSGTFSSCSLFCCFIRPSGSLSIENYPAHIGSPVLILASVSSRNAALPGLTTRGGLSLLIVVSYWLILVLLFLLST